MMGSKIALLEPLVFRECVTGYLGMWNQTKNLPNCIPCCYRFVIKIVIVFKFVYNISSVVAVYVVCMNSPSNKFSMKFKLINQSPSRYSYC